ncbi:hypothetical protein [Aquabacterium sp.]|uniref:hypothetical protein n=1 Tax=Aquabacterium sp. TaxID=1872578 RepID=UPI002488158C|nr:hypothetical protein [Aquabacterium sp.]MDI1347752.1 hypothetical protein [Aquabacterium sp.]
MPRSPALSAITVVFLLGLALLYPLLLQPIVPYDEGFVLERARRVLHGDIPHLDFWSIYPAGQYHLVALAYAWLGESITSSRLVDVLVRLLTACVVTWGVAHVMRNKLVALTTGLLMLAALGGAGSPGYPGFTAMLLILAAASVWATAASQSSPRNWTLTAGALLGLAAWFRHDMAGYALVACLTAELCTGRFTDKRAWQAMAFGLIGAGAMGAIGLAHQLTEVSLETLVQQLVQQPAEVMPAYRRTPWPDWRNPRTISVWLVPLSALVVLASTCMPALRQAPLQVRRLQLMHAFVATALLAQLSIRKDAIHAVPALMALIPAMCVTAALIWPNRAKTAGSWVLLLTVCGLLLTLSARPAGKTLLNTLHALKRPPVPALLTRQGMAELTAEQEVLLNWLQTRPHDAGLYVGVNNHDQFGGNEPIWYFLSGMGSTVFLDELHPGVANLQHMQARTMEEIRSRSMRYVLLVDSPCEQGNESCNTPSLDLLDGYLEKNYQVRLRLKKYTILEIKENPEAATLRSQSK